MFKAILAFFSCVAIDLVVTEKHCTVMCLDYNRTLC